MARMAAPIYLRSDAVAAVEEQLKALLSDESQRADLTSFDEFPPPVVIWPSFRGWIAVTGCSAWLRDLPRAARQLSQEGILAISCEIFGNCYRARLASFLGGEEQLYKASPEALWPDADDTVQQPMPLYEDVEQICHQHLREAEVPTALEALGGMPLGKELESIAIGVGRSLSPDPESNTVHSDDTEELALPGLEDGEDAPIFPTRLGRDFGLMVFEDRYLEGSPGDQALQRLFELEGAYQERARRATEDSGLDTTYSYFCGSHQPRMDQMLQSHDRHTLPHEERFRPPWWQFWRYIGKMR